MPQARPRKVSDARTQFNNFLVYGKAGVGKSTLAATCPPPVLILDCEQGLSSLRNFDPELAKDLGIDLDPDRSPKDIYFEPIRSLDDIKAQVARVRSDNTESPGYWGTVVLDSLTEIQRILIADRLAATKQALLQQQDWGVLLFQCETIVRGLRSLPVHTLFLAQEKEEISAIGPELSGQIGRALPRHFDVMARLTLWEKEEEKDGKKVIKQIRKLRMRRQLTPPVEAKCRFHHCGEWENPHISLLIEKTLA